MCNYKYQFKKHHLTDAPCIYPAFYAEYTNEFPQTKLLPVDSDGFCLFHSRDENWKVQNGFSEKFQELLNVTMAICKNPNPPKWAFNFSGFYFFQREALFTNSHVEILHSIDFTFCEFVNEFSITNAKIKSIDFDNSRFYEILKMTHVNVSANINATRSTFDNGVAISDCVFEGYTYFDHCTFKNEKKNFSNGLSLKNSRTDYLNFENSLFDAAVILEKNVFQNEVLFDKCKFSDEFYFHDNVVNSTISFRETAFLLAENANPMYSSVDFAKVKVNKNGKLIFCGSGPMEDTVKGELQISFETEPEGLISFENFNLNKIYPAAKLKLFELEKTGQVEIGKGCRKYYCQTDIFEITAAKSDQQLILDMVKVFCNYFDIHNHYNLGIEIVERKPDLIRYFFFTDETISKQEFESRIKQNEYDLWRTFASLSENAGEQLPENLTEERNTLIDMAAIFLKIRMRILAIDYREEQLKEIINAIAIDGNSVVDKIKLYEAIRQGFQSFYQSLPSIKINQLQNKPDSKDFIVDFIEGIRRLQSNDKNEVCIQNIRDNILDESPFRYWFITWLSARGYRAEAETEKGSGRIDLKAEHDSTGKKIIEFKGWWNKDKPQIVAQVHSYLTEFEGDGYIFMINHNREKNITESYKKLITNPETGYKGNSWEEILYSATNFAYYKSVHRLGTKEKTLYHFIFSVY